MGGQLREAAEYYIVRGYNINLSDYSAPTGQGRNMVGGKKAEAADTVLTKMYTLQ